MSAASSGVARCKIRCLVLDRHQSTVGIVKDILERDGDTSCRLAWTRSSSGACKESGLEFIRTFPGIKAKFVQAFSEDGVLGSRVVVFQDVALLKRLIWGNTLGDFATVVVDDLEERGWGTDLLIGLLKFASVNVVFLCKTSVMAHQLVRFYDDRPEIVDMTKNDGVEKTILYRDVSPVRNVIRECAKLIREIHQEKPSQLGNMLVFLPNEESVWKCENLLGNLRGSLNIVCSTGNSKVVLDNARRNCVLTSQRRGVDMDNLTIVIDSMLRILSIFDMTTGMTTEHVTGISRMEAEERAALSQDLIYRVCTEKAFWNERLVSESPVSELQCMDAARPVLALLAMGKTIEEIDFFPPGIISATRALNDLFSLNVVDERKTLRKPFGERVARLFPLEPMLATLLIHSLEFGCSEEALTIVAFLSSETSPFRGNVTHSDCVTRFGAKEGDLVFLVNIYNGWNLERKERFKFCAINGLENGKMERVVKVRDALQRSLSKMAHEIGTQLLSCCEDVSGLQRCITHAFALQAATRIPSTQASYETIHGKQRIEIDSSSLFHGRELPNYIVFAKLEPKVKFITSVRAEWLLETKLYSPKR